MDTDVQPPSSSSAERPIGYWVKVVDLAIEHALTGSLEEHGLTRREWQLLATLRSAPSTLVSLESAVAPFTADEPDTVRELLEELLESVWVERQDEHYVLTELGRTSHDRIAVTVQGIRAVTAEGIEEADYLTTVRTLERIARNHGWTD